ncbi:MAG: hypothetical protein AUG49_13630 [Catenulispora sp. 13_1_20CM_3_70_7]|nr:MAG: hypothetical protein AUG49_13630 [Catenulispora sp. 13_1_20CM_3_70_7]
MKAIDTSITVAPCSRAGSTARATVLASGSLELLGSLAGEEAHPIGALRHDEAGQTGAVAHAVDVVVQGVADEVEAGLDVAGELRIGAVGTGVDDRDDLPFTRGERPDTLW